MNTQQIVGAAVLNPYEQLPDDAQAVVMAIAILSSRISRLPKSDRDDLFDLLLAMKNTDDPEETASIRRAMNEILTQAPLTLVGFPLVEKRPLSGGLESWAKVVGKKIRELRDAAGMNQTQLAEKAGLTQSHISRLENAEHSATNFTLEKIAKALGVTVGDLDPCVD